MINNTDTNNNMETKTIVEETQAIVPVETNENKNDCNIAKFFVDGTSENPEKFVKDNFIKDGVEHPAMKQLEAMGIKVWMTPSNKIKYQVLGGEIQEVSLSEAGSVFSALLGYKLLIKTEPIEGNKDPDAIYLDPFNLIVVMAEVFEPNIHSEFFIKNGLYYRNKFRPTYFMELVGKPIKKAKIIYQLIFNLCSNSEERVAYFYNWLAYIFQNRRKAVTTVLITGTQGSGKMIMWDIIEMLFGGRTSHDCR